MESPLESPIVSAFRQYAKDLSAKHDKFERIAKISKEITYESKKLIFATHALPKDSEDLKNSQSVKNIEGSIKKLLETHFKKIALELEHENKIMYHRAYTWGVQEFIEALTHLKYVTSSELIGWKEVVDLFTFTVQSENSEERSVSLHIPVADYILGVQDLTGEVMRLCIMSLGKGNVKAAERACHFVKCVYTGFQLLSSCHREYDKKLEVAEQSLRKMEYGCFSAKIQSIDRIGIESIRPVGV